MTSIQRTIQYAAMGFAILLTLFIVSVIFEVLTGIFGGVFGDEKSYKCICRPWYWRFDY